MRTPHWAVRAYTNVDKKHCFSRVIVSAKSRRAAQLKVLNFTSRERILTGWQGGAGHVITVSPYPTNYGNYS